MVSILYHISSLYFIINLFTYIVPSGPALSVILSSPTSTSINVNWDLPDPMLRNGVIIKHQLNYSKVSQPSNWNFVELNASTSYLLEGLEIFTKYYIFVSAGTKVGFGPSSLPVIYRTLNDSKHLTTKRK